MDGRLPWDPFTASTLPLQWAQDHLTVQSLKSIVDYRPATKTRPVKTFAWAKNILSINSDRPHSTYSPKSAEEADKSTTLESHELGDDHHLEDVQQRDYELESLIESTKDTSKGVHSIPTDDSLDESTSTSPGLVTKSPLPEASVPVNQPAERDSMDEMCE